jgi:flagellar basal-body rod protein FlgB
MFFNDVVNSSSIPSLDAMLSFTQAQHRVLAENIANVDTPGYRTKHLDSKQFQKSLASAVARQREERSDGLAIDSSQQVEQDADGFLTFKPTEDPAENVLFHDQTNARIERQMALLAENGMMHQTVTELLNGKYQGLMQAIRGQVS